MLNDGDSEGDRVIYSYCTSAPLPPTVVCPDCHGECRAEALEVGGWVLRECETCGGEGVVEVQS